MSNRHELNAAMQAKLAQAGVPFEDIKVFGVIRVNVHVVCVSADTASKWVHLLHRVFGKSPTVSQTIWNAVQNKGTCLKPTMRRGHLVSLIA
jgi:hypothetical protein